jgi:hypothetical protein
MTVHLHIDRLVLDGLPVPAHAGGAVSIAVEAELTRLIEAGGLHLPDGISVPRLAAPGVTVDPKTTPGVLGTRIAGALFSGLSQQEVERPHVGSPSSSMPREVP